MGCELSQDILYDCTAPPIAGALDNVILIPRRVITAITLNSSNHLIVEGITLESGERGYQYTGNGDLRNLSDQQMRDEYGVRWEHGFTFKIFGATPVIKKELEALANEPQGVVAIVRQNYQGTSGNSAYVVLGKDCGLQVRTAANTEGKAVYNVELFSSAGYEEPHPHANIYLTSLAATKLLVDALLVADTA